MIIATKYDNTYWAFFKWTIVIAFIFLPKNNFGQNTVSTSFSFTKTDFFHGVEYGRSFHSVDVLVGVEYGIIRTYFQSRFFPKVKILSFYNVVNKPKFKTGVGIGYDYSLYRFGTTSKDITQFHALNGGVRWSYGKKWRIGQTLLIGGLWERNYHVMDKKYRSYGTLGYVLQIDFTYAF
ncbi:MAG: hypothetical protein M9916_04355 [Crocinitomicaceae bacterium]|nr:hypothetical protein [Crocinitomicaceae bacterium]